VTSVTLTVSDVSRSFSRRPILRGLSCELRGGEALAVVGRNGAGKSTFIKIACGLLSPSSGRVTLEIGGAVITDDARPTVVGLAAPYLQVYDEFTAIEHLSLTARLRGMAWTDARSADLLDRIGLADVGGKPIRAYSSGMLQRFRLVTALQHDPALLVLDEPSSNLDERGVEAVAAIVGEQLTRGAVLLATNSPVERSWCGRELSVQ
jgi:heme exporter protein A